MWPFSTYPELKPHEIANRTFDYIIVGGGTAGCCLAARLSENPNTSVLVIERGRVDDTWASRVPLISANLYAKDAFCAIFDSAPVVNANNRKLDIIIGEGLGGGSRVNSCVYTRGIGDCNKWKEMGHPNWGYDELEPLFAKSETTLSKPESHFRGKKGPWMNQAMYEFPFKPHTYVYQAAKRMGLPHIADINSPDEPAVGIATMDVTSNEYGERHSTMRAFVPQPVAVTRKANLHICSNTLVCRLKISNNPGKKPKVQGVFFQSPKDNRTFSCSAHKEVILCAGPIANPQLLMLSGIGPKAQLDQFHIKVVKDMQGVGGHLGDHIGVHATWEVPVNDSLHIVYNKPLRVLWDLIRYITSGKGIFATYFLQSSIFVRTSLLNEKSELTIRKSDLDIRRPENIPDIEILPSHHRANSARVDPILDKIGVFNLMVALVQPKSRGSVRLRSSSPLDRPIVDLGFFTNPEDIDVLRKGLRFSLKLAHQMTLEGCALKPIASQLPASDSDKDMDSYIRENARSCLHYTSTCRMAPEEDPNPGVVDDELRVHGIDGLRIADTSVFPDIISTHTMAGAVVVAEKCAQMIIQAD